MLFSGFGKEKKKNRKSEQAADIWDDFSTAENTYDILGSYTGQPVNDSLPEQDADDL